MKNLYCVKFKYEDDNNSLSHFAASDNEEMISILNDLKNELNEAGIVGWSFFKITKTDNGCRVIIQ